MTFITFWAEAFPGVKCSNNFILLQPFGMGGAAPKLHRNGEALIKRTRLFLEVSYNKIIIEFCNHPNIFGCICKLFETNKLRL